jgi:D-inositol-3-phosphate glycosyltransferase
LATVKRVAVISYHCSPLDEPGSGDAGGMTVYVRGLASALEKKGVHTDIFTRAVRPDDRTVSLSPFVRVVPLEAGPLAPVGKEDLPRWVDEFSAAVRAFAMMQRISYDVIHSHYWQSGLVGRSLASVWSIPFVHSSHTLGRVKNAALAPGDSPEPESRLGGEKDVIDAADVLIASTDDEYQQLACMYGAPHDKLKILPPGVDHQIFSPGDKAAARRELDLGSEPILLYVGRIQALKGIDLAIHAAERLKHALDVPPRLLIVGGPSGTAGDGELERLRALVEELGVSSNVDFLGPQPHGMLPTFYRAADVAVICSHSESFGLTALEAHACGTPVVGTPVGGLSHIVSSGESGFLIDERDADRFASAIKTLLSDPEVAESFSAQAVRRAVPFTWTNTAARFLELYECLVSEKYPELCTC